MFIVEIIQNNSILIISALLSLMVLLTVWKIKQTIEIKNTQGLVANFNMPFKQFKKIIKQKIGMPKIFMILLLIVFAVTSFVSLFYILPLWGTILLFLPMAVIVLVLFMQIMWWLAHIIRKLVALENSRLTSIFSTTIILLALIAVCFNIYDIKSNSTFIIIVFNLMVCYLMILIGMGQLLQEANSKNRLLTFKNLWKSTLLIFTLFIIILSLFSYAGHLHYSNAFIDNGALGYFDMVYYTCVTFATVGYGDIAPTVMFTKAVSILTIATSVISITILLSAMMSVRKSDHE